MEAENKYSLVHAPIWSFFSADFYKDVGENWRGTGFLYLMWILSISWLVGTAHMCKPIESFVNDKHATKALAQVPKQTYRDGKLSIDKPVPYYLYDNEGVKMAVFRTVDNGHPQVNDPPVVITQTQILCKNIGDYKVMFELAGGAGILQNMEIDGAGLMQLLQMISLGVPVFIYCLGLPTILTGHLLLALAYAAITMLVANLVMSKQMPFQTLLRISAIALTPSIVISTAIELIDLITGSPVNLLDQQIFNSGDSASTLTWYLLLHAVMVPMSVGFAIFGVSKVTPPLDDEETSR